MKQFGIDISRWQEGIDLAKAKKEGAKFVVLRGGGNADGLFVDRDFESFYREAKKLGLAVGVYWYSDAQSNEDARREAEYLITNILKGKQFELPVYIDVEEKTMLAVGKRKLTDIVRTWCDYVQSRGYFVGIYASLDCFRSRMLDDELKTYAHWVAHWAKECGYTDYSCLGMWQFGGEFNPIRSNKVAGYVCDQDYMLVDYPSIIKNGGFNGFGVSGEKITNKTTPTTPKTATKTVSYTVKSGDTLTGIAGKYGTTYHEIAKLNSISNPDKIYVGQKLKIVTKYDVYAVARDVIAGKYGNGLTRRIKLKAAGYDYATVQNAVEELL